MTYFCHLSRQVLATPINQVVTNTYAELKGDTQHLSQAFSQQCAADTWRRFLPTRRASGVNYPRILLFNHWGKMAARDDNFSL
ncbi:MAG: hypothetical protein H6662_02900 [Ardenticatenaceae bacterium]|nr:hypothetical protein [Ardenticatenaceae bacterium]